ncbi:unnamed protein product [Adineta steineri]|uniref:V-SNARE coiled-coil homology domain-containing protein n=1 Tax=Adineta steineri TaxID=433720 RepID=A0A818JMP3_9BILA|nr:unnamed protein product [Adineta steineri]CAF3542086.1 unnamed protein product [Adineta steineri]
MLGKLSLKSSRSVPIIINNEKSLEKQNSPSSYLNIKSAIVLNNRTSAQESQEHLDAMHKIVDQTDNDLRYALEHVVNRREQLDQLQYRSEEMLSKNENLVFGITNYRKTQERDIFWQRFRYSAFGILTIGIIILIIILSMTSKRSIPSSQIIDIRYLNQDLSNKNIASTTVLTTFRRRRRKRQRLNELFT